MSPGPTTSGKRRAVGFGKYRLFARIGSGGMADVYLAVAQGALNVNRLVVIKRLRDEHANDSNLRGMFLDEARLAARLAHPNVIQTFEAGVEDGSFFLAMEYVDGQPLSRILTSLKRSGKVLPARIAARICSDALAGLHYAHEYVDFDGTPLDIVHRDVSPQNIMITYEGTVKLVDFGIAKAVGTTETAHGVFKGKIAFMAPEQVRSAQVDRRADLFAAGIVLWESLTGKLLMADSTPAKTLYNVMTKPIPAPSEVNPEVPPELDAIVLRALQRSADERYATAKEMRDDLEAFLASSGGASKEEIGELTLGLFSDTRNKVQEQIKSQLATLSLGRSGNTAYDMSDTQVRSMTNVLIDLDDGSASGSSAGSLFQAILTQSGPKPGARPVALFAWFGLPVLALLVAGLALLRLGPTLVQTERTAPPVTSPTVLPASAAAPQPEGAISTTTVVPSPPPTGTHGSSAAPPRAPVAFTPPTRPTAAPPAFTPAAAPRPAPPSPVAPPAPSTTAAKPAEAPTGRTFRREM